jgi:hypothetical protein
MGINAITADVLDSLQALVRPGGRAATLGTQDIQPEVLAARAARLDPALAGRADRQYLRACGWAEMEAIDLHPAADVVLDLNQPLPSQSPLNARYDTVLDMGTTEHIFDVKEALFNIASLVGEGGRVVHFNPVQGYCNHSFVLMQPTLYFSFYEANGFAVRYCGIVEYLDEQQRSARLIPVTQDFNNLRFSSANDSMVVVVAERLDMRPRSDLVVPTQAFYRKLFDTRARLGVDRLPDPVYREILGDVPANHRARLLAAAQYFITP